MEISFKIKPLTVKIKTHITFLSLAFLIACGKDEVVEQPVSLDVPGKLEVQVRLCLNAVCDSTVQVPGAHIFLFENEQYRSEGSPFAYDGATNGFGKIRFETLDSSQYWLKIKMPQPDARVKLEYAKTPKRTTTFVDVVFKKE